MIDSGASEPDRSLRLLVFQALRLYKSRPLLAFLKDKSSLVRTAAARELQSRGERVAFVEACRLIESKKPAEREIAAFLLGQFGFPEMPFRTESIPLLEGMLRHDPRAAPRAAAAAALGHLRSKSSLEVLLEAAGDEAPDVRAAVAFALQKFPRSKRAKLGLEGLREDEDESVREWACL